jgi:hypothetical protein
MEALLAEHKATTAAASKGGGGGGGKGKGKSGGKGKGKGGAYDVSSRSKGGGGRGRGAGGGPTISRALLMQLVEMGFPESQCQKALVANRNNVDAALTWILSGGGEEVDDHAGGESNLKTEDEEAKDSEAQANLDEQCGKYDLLTIVNGQSKIGLDYTSEGMAGEGFASVGSRLLLVTEGQWYYEATLQTAGCIQLGWADAAFIGMADVGEGVGDGSHSWAYDGWRQLKWHGGSCKWGRQWRAKDVVGCLVNMDERSMSFTLNGSSVGMGVAFTDFESSGGVYPCASFNSGQSIRWNFGVTPFKFPPPEGYRPIFESLATSVLENIPSNNPDGEGCGQSRPDDLDDCLEEIMFDDRHGKEDRYFSRSDLVSQHEISARAAESDPRKKIFYDSAGSLSVESLAAAAGESDTGAAATVAGDDAGTTSDMELFQELHKITVVLQVLHSRKCFLMLLANLPKDILRTFPADWLACISPESTDRENLEPLMIQFLQLITAPSLSATAPSSFTPMFSNALNRYGGVDIETFDFSDMSQALHILTPVITEALLQSVAALQSGDESVIASAPNAASNKSPDLVRSIVASIETQLNTIARREFSYVPWGHGSAAIAQGLMSIANEQIPLSQDASGVDQTEPFPDSILDILAYPPNLQLILWMTSLVMKSCPPELHWKSKACGEVAVDLDAGYGRGRGHGTPLGLETHGFVPCLFSTWCILLRSPSSCLMEYACSTLASLLQLSFPAQLPILTGSHSSTVADVGSAGISVSSLYGSESVCAVLPDSHPSKQRLELLLQCVPVARVIRLCEERISMERETLPLVPSHLQALVEFASLLRIAVEMTGFEMGGEDAGGAADSNQASFNPVDLDGMVDDDSPTLKRGTYGQPVALWPSGPEPNVLADAKGGVQVYTGIISQAKTTLPNETGPKDLSVPKKGDTVVLTASGKAKHPDLDGVGDGKVESVVQQNLDVSGRNDDGSLPSSSAPGTSTEDGTACEIRVLWATEKVTTHAWNAANSNDRDIHPMSGTGSPFGSALPPQQQQQQRGGADGVLQAQALQYKAIKEALRQEMQYGVILRILKEGGDDADDDDAGCTAISGEMELPDFGAVIRISGEQYQDGSIMITEEELVRGSIDMGWVCRFGHDEWHAGATYNFKPLKRDTTCLEGYFTYSVMLPNQKKAEISGGIRVDQDELFQFDRMSAPVSIEISPSGKSVTCLRDTRSMVIGTIGFSSGVHYWEVKIDKAEFGSVFIGVAEKPAIQEAVSGKISRWNGWGFVNFRATVACGHTMGGNEHYYGDHFNDGDIIGVRLDADRGKMAFFMDGCKFGEHIITGQGVAFDRLNARKGMNKTFFPAIGFKKAGDRVSLCNKWISAPGIHPRKIMSDASSITASLSTYHESCASGQPVQNAFSEPLLLEAWHNWRRWQEGRWVRYPSRCHPVSVELDTSTAACHRASKKLGLPFLAKAGDVLKVSSSMGRDLEHPEQAQVLGAYRDKLWYRLLFKTNDNGAVEGPQHAWYWGAEDVSGLSVDDAAAAPPKPKDEEMAVQASDSAGAGVGAGVLSSATGDLDDAALPLSSPMSKGCSMTRIGSVAWQATEQQLKEMLTHEEEAARLSFDRFLALVNPRRKNVQWTSVADNELIEIVNRISSDSGVEAFNLPFASLLSSDEEAKANTTAPGAVSAVKRHHLANVPGPILRARCAVLRTFNSKMKLVLPFLKLRLPEEEIQNGNCWATGCCQASMVYISDTGDYHGDRPCIYTWPTMGRTFRSLRQLIFTDTKRVFWDGILRATTTPTQLPQDEYEDPKELKTVRINCIQALAKTLGPIPSASVRLRKSVFGQLYREMRNWSEGHFRRAFVGKGHGGQQRAFKVKFLGEGVNDYGGPYRAVFEKVAEELQTERGDATGGSCILPFLIPTPNRRAGVTDDQDKFILNPNPAASSFMAFELIRFLGKIMGTSMRHGLQMGLDFPSSVWKPLTGLPVSPGVLSEIDALAGTHLKRAKVPSLSLLPSIISLPLVPRP